MTPFPDRSGTQVWTRIAPKCLLLVLLLFLDLVGDGQALGIPLLTAAPSDGFLPPTDYSVVFVQNSGQFAQTVRFQAQGKDESVWLTDDSLWWTFTESADAVASTDGASSFGLGFRGANVRVEFQGVSRNVRVEPLYESALTFSYFKGRDARNWHFQVPTWGGVRYRELYDGLDLILTGRNGHLDPHLLCKHNCNSVLSRVRIHVDGGRVTTATTDALHVETPIGVRSIPLFTVDKADGTLSDLSRPPVIEQGLVSSPFRTQDATARHVLGPAVDKEIPDLLYSTYLGGTMDEWALDVAVNQSGEIYIAGLTMSSDFPSHVGEFSGSAHDAFVAVLDPKESGTSGLKYAAFIGGAGATAAWGIDVTSTGSIFLAGSTTAPDLPVTSGAYDSQGPPPGWEPFVIKLTGGGNIEYCTYLGGDGSDIALSIAVDDKGQAHVAGRTFSTAEDFHLKNAFDSTADPTNGDAFLVTLDFYGQEILYGTFLGGSAAECRLACGVTVDPTGLTYIVGETESTDFPIWQAYDGELNEGNTGWALYDAFVVKIDTSNAQVEYSTYLGGSNRDSAAAVAADPTGAAYVVGDTRSVDFPTTENAFQKELNYYDAFVTKITANGSDLIYSTFIGGASRDDGYDIASTDVGNAFIAGFTYSEDFPGAPSPSSGAYVARLTSDGSDLHYTSVLGPVALRSGGLGNIGVALALGPLSRVAFVGTTGGDYPVTSGAYLTTTRGGLDIVASVVDAHAPQLDVRYVDQVYVEGDVCPECNEWTYCGPSSGAMLAHYEKAEQRDVLMDPAPALRLACDLKKDCACNPVVSHCDGPTYRGEWTRALSDTYDLKAYWTDVTFEKLKESIDNNHPAILSLNGSVNGSALSHITLVSGYRQDESPPQDCESGDYIVLNDPIGGSLWWTKTWWDADTKIANVPYTGTAQFRGESITYCYEDLEDAYFYAVLLEEAVPPAPPVEALVGSEGETISGKNATIYFPPLGPVASTTSAVTVTYSELLAPTQPWNAFEAPVRTFQLAAEDAEATPLFAYSVPFTIELQVDLSLLDRWTVGDGVAAENVKLQLVDARYVLAAWDAAANEWRAVQAQKIDNRTELLTAHDQAFSEFVLFVEREHSVYLPIVLRSSRNSTMIRSRHPH